MSPSSWLPQLLLTLQLILFMLQTTSSSSFSSDLDFRVVEPKINDLLMAGPVNIEVEWTSSPLDAFRVCVLLVDSSYLLQIKASLAGDGFLPQLNLIEELTLLGRHNCLEPGMLMGHVQLSPQSWIFGIYIADAVTLAQLAPTNFVSFQVVEYKSQNLTATRWKCTDYSTCFSRFVEMITLSAATATAASTATTTTNNEEAATATKDDGDDDGNGFLLKTSFLSPEDTSKLLDLSNRVQFDTDLDTIDKQPVFQLDLWNKKNGVPRPSLTAFELTAEVYRVAMPSVLRFITGLYSGRFVRKCVNNAGGKKYIGSVV
jgi:hypothetical protein